MDLYKSILITGGNGMLAQALRKLLDARNLPYAAAGHSDADVTNPTQLKDLFARYKPTLVLNCAAHTKVDLCETETEKADAINGHAVGALASLARQHNAFLVHYSTDFVFDGSATRPYRTTDPVNPLSAYGRSKLLGEQLLQKNAPPSWLILRTAWLYGRGGPNFPRTIIERARQGAPLKVVNDQIGSPTYTADLAQATLDLLDRNQTGLFHITNSGQTSWYDFARAALQAFAIDGAITPISTADWTAIRPKQAHRPAYSVLDTDPFTKTTGHPMRPWREALDAFRQEVAAAGSM
jgi:dTDP-4-dehydrorhamnose reductase